MDDPRPVEVERVSGHVRPGILVDPGSGGAALGALEPELALEPERGPALGRISRSPSRPALAEAVAHEAMPACALVALLLLTGDAGLVVSAGVAIYAFRGLHSIAGAIRFGFGDGFLGFRDEVGWPRGVQEDDDFHWSWSPDGGLARPPNGRLATARRPSGAWRQPTTTAR